jgi:hypothetical protein
MTPREFIREYLPYCMIFAGNVLLAGIIAVDGNNVYTNSARFWIISVDIGALLLTAYRHYKPVTPKVSA